MALEEAQLGGEPDAVRSYLGSQQASTSPLPGIPSAPPPDPSGAVQNPGIRGSAFAANSANPAAAPDAAQAYMLQSWGTGGKTNSELSAQESTDNQGAKNAYIQMRTDAADAQRPPRTPPPSPSQVRSSPQWAARQAMSGFMNPLMWLAIAGGAMTKRGAINAMTAATGFMEGARNNDVEKAKLNQQKFRNSVKETEAANAQELAAYNAVWNNPNLSAAEKLSELDGIASGHGNQDMKGFIAKGDTTTIGNYLHGREQMQQHLGKARGNYDKVAERQAKDTDAARVKAIAEYDEPPDEKNQTLMRQVRKYREDNNLGPFDANEFKRRGSGKQQEREQGDRDVKDIVAGLKEGTIDPNKAFYRQNAAIAAESNRQGFDLAKAQLERKQAEAEMKSLNSQRMQQFAGVARDIDRQGEEVKLLAKQMDLGGIGILNTAQLTAYIKAQGNSENGKLATRYISAVNTLKEMFANFAPGGYAPTESVWHLANQQINDSYGAQQMATGVEELQRAVRYRLKAIAGFEQLGPGSPNRYIPSSAPQQDKSGRFGNLRAPSEDELSQARAAIEKGAPRDAVIKMLNDNGIDHGGL